MHLRHAEYNSREERCVFGIDETGLVTPGCAASAVSPSLHGIGAYVAAIGRAIDR
jgi:hypothetical protein